MRLLICGDRNWGDYNLVKRWVNKLDPAVIIEGEATGADSMARLAGESLGIPVEKYPAEWEKFGRAAGPIRNRQMLARGRPDCIIAFHDDLSLSKGTKDIINAARKAGFDVTLISHRGVTQLLHYGSPGFGLVEAADATD